MRPSRRLRLSAIAASAMVIAFAAFFQITKHDHGISTIALFVHDPYDAVGSFGVQLAGLAAALALVRAFAPDPSDADVLTRAFLVGRACATAILAVGVSLAADGEALVRPQSDWASAEGGAALGLDWLAMALLTTVIGWFLRPMLRISDGRSRPHWQAAVVRFWCLPPCSSIPNSFARASPEK